MPGSRPVSVHRVFFSLQKPKKWLFDLKNVSFESPFRSKSHLWGSLLSHFVDNPESHFSVTFELPWVFQGLGGLSPGCGWFQRDRVLHWDLQGDGTKLGHPSFGVPLSCPKLHGQPEKLQKATQRASPHVGKASCCVNPKVSKSKGVDRKLCHKSKGGQLPCLWSH